MILQENLPRSQENLPRRILVVDDNIAIGEDFLKGCLFVLSKVFK